MFDIYKPRLKCLRRSATFWALNCSSSLSRQPLQCLLHLHAAYVCVLMRFWRFDGLYCPKSGLGTLEKLIIIEKTKTEKSRIKNQSEFLFFSKHVRTTYIGRKVLWAILLGNIFHQKMLLFISRKSFFSILSHCGKVIKT